MTAGAARAETTELGPLRAPGEVRSIQYLRGFAAFGVVAFHASERAGYQFDVGTAGVDVFFVISGFVMWMVTSSKTLSPGEFLARRVQRIVPLYWGVTLAVAAVALLIPGSFPGMRPTVGHVVQSLLFIPHRGETGMIAPLIVPGWTLNYEMFFYLLFAAGLFAPARVRPWALTAALVSLVAIRPLTDVRNPLWATYTDPLLLEFGAGVWLGKAWSHGRLAGPRHRLGAGRRGLGGFHRRHSGRPRCRADAGPSVGPARLALVAGAVSLEHARPLPHWWPIRALGDASYSVYVVHALAISAAFRLFQKIGLASPTPLFVLSSGVAAGMLVYQLVEKPMMKWFHTGMAARRPTL